MDWGGEAKYSRNLLRAVRANDLLEQRLEVVSVLPQETARQLVGVTRVIAGQAKQRLCGEPTVSHGDSQSAATGGDKELPQVTTSEEAKRAWYLEAGVEEKGGKERRIGQVAQEERLVAGVLLAEESGPRRRLQQREDQPRTVLHRHRHHTRPSSATSEWRQERICEGYTGHTSVSPGRGRSGSGRAGASCRRCRA